MNKQYLKQAWNLLRQEKFFSSIYILGTGLSITVVMVLSIVLYVRLANIYPETNRDRILVVQNAVENYEEGGFSSSRLSIQLIETVFQPLESAEAVTATISYHEGEENYVQPEGSSDQWPVTVQYVDTAYWRVFSFRFLHGQPFSGADFRSGIRVAVIAESLAKRLFGTIEVRGQYMSLNFETYRISGVVKDVSFVTERTYAQIWVPYTLVPDYKGTFGRSGSLGKMTAFILAPSTNEVGRVKEEALDRFHRYASQYEEESPSIVGQPDRHWQSTLRTFSTSEPDFTKALLQYGFIFLILLLVPAISLSGMADSRMERRLAEMGVRRAFGAPRSSLMGQVFSENFLFTLLGGGVGLLFSYLLVLLSRSWIMGLGKEFAGNVPDGVEVVLTPAMLLNMPVFGIALLVCFLLNLLSAMIPAWKVSHQEIVYSLNT
ncbi:ABC transporter permease [Bacteroidia bacterium]|nr:ABC transporter permease [Bacteroidia bacterium]